MKKNINRRVVVTGLGVISPIGLGWNRFWRNCVNGKSGIHKIKSFDTSEYDRHYAGEVRDFDPAKYINYHKIPYLGRASQFAIASSKMALEDAGIHQEDLLKKMAGLFIGTTMGEPKTLEFINQELSDRGFGAKKDLPIWQYPSNVIGANLAHYFGIKGKTLLISTACSSGNYAIGHAYDHIKSGRLNIVLAGGVDSMTRLNITGFSRLFAMSMKKCQPFDKNRSGMLVSEGAGFLVVESMESALNRGANIYAELLGYKLSCDATHMTMPSKEGIIQCILGAVKNAKIRLDDIDYISAHGTGTVQNDKTEALAINYIFRDMKKRPPISSIKSMLGHTMGAASAIEAITCCLAITKNTVPPTINFETFDPECNVDCIPNQARQLNVDIALNNSFAFGGNNACVVLRKFKNRSFVKGGSRVIE